MLNTQTEWVDLFTQPIFNQRFNVALIFTVEFSVDFVVSADVNTVSYTHLDVYKRQRLAS